MVIKIRMMVTSGGELGLERGLKTFSRVKKKFYVLIGWECMFVKTH